jgi:hypothetical protein
MTLGAPPFPRRPESPDSDDRFNSTPSHPNLEAEQLTWLASSAALPPTPSTRRFSRPPRAITAAARTPSAPPRQAVEKLDAVRYRDRKRNKKRNFRALWIQRINAAVREHGNSMTYGRFIDGLNKAGIEDRPQGARRHRRTR